MGIANGALGEHKLKLRSRGEDSCFTFSSFPLLCAYLRRLIFRRPPSLRSGAAASHASQANWPCRLKPRAAQAPQVGAGRCSQAGGFCPLAGALGKPALRPQGVLGALSEEGPVPGRCPSGVREVSCHRHSTSVPPQQGTFTLQWTSTRRENPPANPELILSAPPSLHLLGVCPGTSGQFTACPVLLGLSFPHPPPVPAPIGLSAVLPAPGLSVSVVGRDWLVFPSSCHSAQHLQTLVKYKDRAVTRLFSLSSSAFHVG